MRGKLKTKAISNSKIPSARLPGMGKGGAWLHRFGGNKRHCQHCGISALYAEHPSLATSLRTACCLARNQGGLSHLCCLPRRAGATTWNLLLSFGFSPPPALHWRELHKFITYSLRAASHLRGGDFGVQQRSKNKIRKLQSQALDCEIPTSCLLAKFV